MHGDKGEAWNAPAMRENSAHWAGLYCLIDGPMGVAHLGRWSRRTRGRLEEIVNGVAAGGEIGRERRLIKGVLIRSVRKSVWPSDEEHWRRSRSTGVRAGRGKEMPVPM